MPVTRSGMFMETEKIKNTQGNDSPSDFFHILVKQPALWPRQIR